MKKINITFLAISLSLLLMTGMASAIDIQDISTWTQSMGEGDLTGIGDVLIGPLYDVRSLKNPDTTEGTTLITTQNTLINLVNTDPGTNGDGTGVGGVIAMIRFREWKRSLEVKDFYIPLSCNGTWQGVLTRLPGGGATITSPVAPFGSSANRWINGLPTAAQFPSEFIAGSGTFIGAFATSQIEAQEGDKLARTEYGYLEVIGVERVECKMNPNGTWNRVAPPGRDVPDVLMGQVYLVRPEAAISHEYNMHALSKFSVNPLGIFAALTPGTVRPNLRDDVQGQGANPGVGGFNQLEAILSKRDVELQYVDTPGKGAPGSGDTTPITTSAVITFPTKWAHYSAGWNFFHVAEGTPLPTGNWSPFTGVFETGTATPTEIIDGIPGGEVVTVAIFDRNENRLTTPNVPISPSGQIPVTILPWEVNIIGFLPQDPPPDPFARGWRDNLVIPTKNAGTGQTFTSGWADFDLSPDPITSGDPRSLSGGGKGWTQGKSGIAFSFFNNFFGPGPAPAGQVLKGIGAYRGLPAMGIVMTEFFNSSFNGYFGNTVPWQYGVDWGENPVPVP